MRVVTLLPSATETLRAWGLDPIACTRFCEQPDLPAVGGTKDPDVAAIVALQPDLVVVDEEENRREDADALAAAGVRVFVTAVRAVADVAPTLHALAAAVGLDVDVDVDLADPPSALGRAGGGASPPARRKAFVPIWRRPWMTINGDTYGSSLLAAVGVVNVYAGDPSRYPETDLDGARARAPDVVIAPSEPYPFTARHEPELASVAPVRFVDGRDLFWWGVRTPAAIERLGAALSPPAR